MNEATKNAWLVKITKNVHLEKYKLTIQHDPTTGLPNIVDSDAFLIVDSKQTPIAFAQILRIRETTKETTYYFDAIRYVTTDKSLMDLQVSSMPENAIMSRMGWTMFENAYSALYVETFSKIPMIGISNNKHEQAYIRELLETAVADDLLGPAGGPNEEILDMGIRDRYLVGKLAPQNLLVEESDELGGDSGKSNEDDSTKEVDGSSNQSLVPSSFGFTFCIESDVNEIELEVEWGRYEKIDSIYIENEKTGIEREVKRHKRIPCGGVKILSLDSFTIEPTVVDKREEKVIVKGSVSKPLDTGDRLVTLFFVNTQEMPKQNQDSAWVFQPKMIARDPNGKAIFRRRPVLGENGSDRERETLEMLYRKRVEFAIGHGMSVHATTNDDSEKAIQVETVVMPEQEIAVTETPGLREEDRPAMREMIDENYLDMEKLATMESEKLSVVLHILTDDYDRWIAEQESIIDNELDGHEKIARDTIARCSEIALRLKEGINVLATNEDALEAFRFANRSMAEQRIHSIYTLRKRRGEELEIDSLRISENRSWRAFQLAFLLLSVPALTNPLHKDRTESLEAYADLLWFPTGGGKTEAYLGVAAFTMGIRRLQGSSGGYNAARGLAVIMRYTLRLLTIQQFQRATALICAMEVERRQDKIKWGEEAFSIGLWVGQKVTPNTTEESHNAIEAERNGKFASGSTPAQLTNCPWCGSDIDSKRDIKVDRERGQTLIYCGDKRGKCEFSKILSPNLGIPIVVVDEELYRRPPTMMIATVDKFAMMAWKGEVRTLFGIVDSECERHGLLWPEAPCSGNHPRKGYLPATSVKQIEPIRPPDLIIQDEFHLISGPLGTMVGLYETAVDELCTWEIDGKSIRPKIVASTATVRKAVDQVKNVFLRNVSIFPPSGLDIEDNFFSIQRSSQDVPGRRYVGIFSPGNSRPAILIRVYVALLTASQFLLERFGPEADPYMTVVGYFNSLRELGGMKRLAEDDVQTRSYKVQMSDTIRPNLAQRKLPVVDELTSRVSSKEIPKKLDQLEVKFNTTLAKDKKNYEVKWEKGETRAIDIILATNMLSVGVDVNRIGLMVVNGQPKNTAEYIQATSRVGRAYPGIVYTVLTWSRPRDLSHYETFEHYHATFYKHVEAQSVTPFSPRALDRGLTGTMISTLRLKNDRFNPNLGAGELTTTTDSDANIVKDTIVDRVWKVKDKNASENADAMIKERLDLWVKEAVKPGRKLGYDRARKNGEVAALVKKPSALAWDKFTVPMSMREVEPGVRLIMDDIPQSAPPSWRTQPKKGDKDA